MKRSIEKRFTIIGVGMIGGFILLNIVLTYLFLIPFSVKISAGQLNKIATDLKAQNMSDSEEFQSYIEQIEDDMSIRITVIDGEGLIIYTTKFNSKSGDYIEHKGPSYKLFSDNIAKLDAGKYVYSSREQENEKVKTIRIFLVKRVGDNRYVILSRSYKSLQNTMKSAIMFELVSGAMLLILGLFIVKRWGSYFVKPIRQITETAEHISNLEFDNKVYVNSEDELGQLAVAINKMSDHLEANVIQLQDDIENRKKLVRNLSHEIKSPIAVIMGYSDRMKAALKKDPDKAIKYSEIISDESSRVDILVKEMLELSRMEQENDDIHMEKIEAKRLFNDLNKRFEQEYMDRDIIYKDEYNSDDTFYADYVLVERAVYNLIRNAATYVSGDPAVIRVNGYIEGLYYVINVFNTGSMIPDEDRKSIWEPFSKVDKARSRSRKGFGVGLAIVREIVEKHKGAYSVVNNSDGVTFSISFKQPK